MSYNNDIQFYSENYITNSPNRFNNTHTVLNAYKFIRTQKTPVIKIAKNLKKNFFAHNNKRILSHNFLKDNFVYNHEKILAFHPNKLIDKDKRCKTFNIDREKKSFQKMASLHKNLLKGKLLKSKLYKYIEKSANDNYIKKKREKEKNTFITMIEEDNSNENKNIFNFEKENEKIETPKVQKIFQENSYNSIDKIKQNTIFKNIKYDDNDIDITNKNIKNDKNLFPINFSTNVTSLSNIKFDYNKDKDKDKNKNKKDNSNKVKLKKRVSFNEPLKLNTQKKKELDLSKLKPISLPCIKFSSSINNYFKYVLQGNSNDKDTLAKTCIAKLRFGVIKKSLLENYKTILEKNEFPKDLANAMFYYYIKEQKYFFEFDDLYKKYLFFLSQEIKNNHFELNNLLEEREKIFNENNILLKRITDLTEELKMYESFKRLCLLVKFRTKNIEDIPIEEIYKYGIKLHLLNTHDRLKIEKKIEIEKEKEKKNIIHKEEEDHLYKRYNLFHRKSTKKIEKRVNKKNNTFNSFSEKLILNRKEPPIFENIDEFFQQIREENINIYKKFEIYNNSFYETKDLESEAEKENKIDQSPNSKYNRYLLKKLTNELSFLKDKNKKLNLYKKQLIEKKMQEEHNNSNNSIFPFYEINISSDNIDNLHKKKHHIQKGFYLEENEHTITLFTIYKKVREILLNPEINIEKILKINKLYNIIKEKKAIKDIKFNGHTYSKEIFHIKILELVYLKLIQWKKRCLKNKSLRNRYLKIKNEREKALKIYKSHQKLLQGQIYLMKRNDIIIDKTNKITFLQNKKIDPYYKKYVHDEVIKNENKLKKQNNITKIESEADKYYNLIQY